MAEALIRIVDLAREYRKGGVTVRALQGMTLEVGRGDLVAIMGPSGSGKSSLMNLLGFLDRPSSGQYWFDGRDVSRLGPDTLAAMRRSEVGFVFQNFNLLGRNSSDRAGDNAQDNITWMNENCDANIPADPQNDE